MDFENSGVRLSVGMLFSSTNAAIMPRLCGCAPTGSLIFM